MSQPLNVIIVEKLGTLKSLAVKDFKLDVVIKDYELYNKVYISKDRIEYKLIKTVELPIPVVTC